nr:hypothetical protein [Tanacetum cinerariifolium]
MTRSSTKELLSPLENPKQNFRSRRRLFDTPSLIDSNLPKFDLISDIKEQLEEEEVILFYNGLDVLTQQILDSKESAKRHEENLNIIEEIHASTDAAIRNQGASIKTLEIQLGQLSKVLQEKGFGTLPSSKETNPKDQVKSILTTDFSKMRRIGCGTYAVSGTQYRSIISKTVPFPRNHTTYPRVWDTTY